MNSEINDIQALNTYFENLPFVKRFGKYPTKYSHIGHLIHKSGFTTDYIKKYIGINKRMLMLRIYNPREFRLWELEKLSKCLKISYKALLLMCHSVEKKTDKHKPKHIYELKGVSWSDFDDLVKMNEEPTKYNAPR